jgi:hypothetical protein
VRPILRSSSGFAGCAFFLVLLLVTVVQPVHADDRQSEYVQELNALFRLSDRFRLFFAASVTQSLTEGKTDGELGAYLDVLSINPIFNKRLVDADWARNRYVWGRVGFAFGGIHEGLELRSGYSEKRYVAELYGRYPVSSSFWLMTRARIDLRELDSERSDRFRLRFGMEKEYTIFGRALVPYVTAEFLYDTRFDRFSRQIYQLGIDIQVTTRLYIEPYYAFQIDTEVSPTHVDRAGLALKYAR